jgi:hypothetical protein
MSSIRIRVGYAEVELSGAGDMRKMSGEVRVEWLPNDLLQATAQALRSMGDPRAEDVQNLVVTS